MYKTFWALTAFAALAQAQNGACDRKCLEGFVNQYLAALEAREPPKLPLAKNARYTKNGVQPKLGDEMRGLWSR